jgi:hypothetical protein
VAKTRYKYVMKVRGEKAGAFCLPASSADPNFFEGFEQNIDIFNPKDDDLYLKRMKPLETKVEVRRPF